MQYILLIYRSEAEAAKRTPADATAIHREYFAYSDAIRKSGNMIGGEPLEDVSTATTVRVRDGKTLRTDGPFAETREQLAGYYVVEAKDLDEAVSLAARIPDARGGSIEVRPIKKLSGM